MLDLSYTYLLLFLLGAEMVFMGGREERPGILGIATLAPEAAIVLGLWENGNLLSAIGSVAGSVVTVYGLIIGVSSLVYFLKWRSKVRLTDFHDSSFMLISSLLLLISAILGRDSFVIGLILIPLAFFYIKKRIMEGRAPKPRSILLLVLGTSLVILTSSPMAVDVVSFAKWVGVSPFIISSILVPVLSNIQELFMALVSSMTRDAGKIISSLISENIQALGFLIGIMTLFSVGEDFTLISPLLALASASGLMLYALLDNDDISPWEGVTMILVYSVIFLFMKT